MLPFLEQSDARGWGVVILNPNENAPGVGRDDQQVTHALRNFVAPTQNVVIIQVIEAPIEGDPKARIDQQVIGSGNGVFFHDGLRVDVTWDKKTAEAPLLFFTADGSEVQFTAGQIWISAVPDLANISES